MQAVNAAPLDAPGWSPAALAEHAVQALRDEATLSPKPGLVDARGSGVHTDLDLARMLRSADALRLPFAQMAEVALGRRPGHTLRARLAHLGRVGEQRMLLATGGSNAHRGAIWALGLLLAAAAMRGPAGRAAALCADAAALAQLRDPQAPIQPASHGQLAQRRWGAGGARAQAAAGFPHALRLGLPTLQRVRRSGAGETAARLDALLAIMAELDDTCLLHRGGAGALQAARGGAAAVLAAGGSATAGGRAALQRLEHDLLQRRASPGGSADLLAVTLLLDRLTPSI